MTINIQNQMIGIGKAARAASLILTNASAEQKNNALIAAAKFIRNNKQAIMEANAKDMAAANEKGISGSFLDRLELNDERIESMANGIESIAKLTDPVGKELDRWQRPNGLDIARISTPLGVIGVIYESRPNVTADAGALCLKAGNAAILRGGSESFHSSGAIMDCLQAGLKEAGLPETSIQLIPTKDREAVGIMLKMVEYIDVIVPRGGKSLIQRIIDDSKIPTFQHLEGLCHTYIHENADAQKAIDIVVNAKMRRTGICGATETMVIDEAIANDLLPTISDALIAESCELRGDEKACTIDSRIKSASAEDWDTEYLAPILSVKIVDDINQAILFINEHNSHHTDSIVTENEKAAEKFLAEIDSAIVMHNLSTQFADGGEFGMGAEIGIATGRMHARGPVGVEQLTTFKYMVRGNGQVRPK